MSFHTIKRAVCPECGNSVHFVEINIGGVITNFDNEPAFKITDVYQYEKVGTYCAPCLDREEYVQVGEEGDALPVAVVEQSLKRRVKPGLKLVR